MSHELEHLTLDEALAIHEALIDRFGGRGGVRDLGLLESALRGSPLNRSSSKGDSPEDARGSADVRFHAEVWAARREVAYLR